MNMTTPKRIGPNYYIIQMLENYNSKVNDCKYWEGNRHYVFEYNGSYWFPEQSLDSIPISYAKKLYKITFTDVEMGGLEMKKSVVCGYCYREIEGAIFAHDDRKVCESCFADYTSFDGKAKNDEVNHPSHYTQLPIECKDVIKNFDSCRGQAIKYIWRCEYKGHPITDLQKAIFWLNEKIKMYEDEGHTK